MNVVARTHNFGTLLSRLLSAFSFLSAIGGVDSFLLTTRASFYHPTCDSNIRNNVDSNAPSLIQPQTCSSSSSSSLQQTQKWRRQQPNGNSPVFVSMTHCTRGNARCRPSHAPLYGEPRPRGHRNTRRGSQAVPATPCDDDGNGGYDDGGVGGSGRGKGGSGGGGGRGRGDGRDNGGGGDFEERPRPELLLGASGLVGALEELKGALQALNLRLPRLPWGRQVSSCCAQRCNRGAKCSQHITRER